MKKHPAKNMQLWLATRTNALYLVDLNRPNSYAEAMFDWARVWQKSLIFKNKPFDTSIFVLIDEWSDQ